MKHNSVCIFRIIGLGILAILISSCAGTSQQYANQPAVNPGSKIELNISSTIPSDSDRIYIQNGKIISKSAIDTYQVYCNLVMNKYQSVNGSELKVTPGEFTVYRVRLNNDYIHNPVIYASTENRFYYPALGVNYRTELFLESPDQPYVKALSCSRNTEDYSKESRFPNSSQIEMAMKELVNLN